MDALLAALSAGKAEESALLLSRVDRADPRLPDANFSMGNLLLGRGNLDAAAQQYRQAVALRPDHAHAHANLGAVLKDRGRAPEAASHLETALRLQPGHAVAAFNLAMLRIGQRRWGDAAALLRQSLTADAAQADAQYWLGNALMGLGDAGQARAAYRAAVQLDGGLVQARWGLAMAQLPAVAQTAQEQSQALEAFGRELDALSRWFSAGRPADGFQAVGAQQPYYLAYIDGNHRELLARYGDLCASLMADWAARVGVPPPAPAATGKLRLGIVSAHIHAHSVWHAILRGWIEHLDPERFEIHLFHTGTVRDAETEWASRRVARLHQGLGEWTAWAKAISDSRLDLLVYPEIGMDATTVRLSALRLARRQLAAWGHPITTGLPTIDAYVSAQAFEPAQAQAHYRERLVALPGLGCAYRPQGVAAVPVNLAQWGVGPADRVLLCAGMPFKYAPQDDALLVDIARRCRPCKLVFFAATGDTKSALLEQRLRRAFESAGLGFDDCVRFIPWQSPANFFGLLRQADVYLDSKGFSGFNTAMQAVECGTPIVAWEGGFLRSRFASGILREMGLQDWVADSAEDFARKVERLCADAALRQQLRAQIAAARAPLFNDRRAVDALATSLQELAAP